MVAKELKRRKERRNGGSGEVFAAIAHHDTRYGGRYVAEHQQFPNMAGAYNDEEITRKCVTDGTQHGIIPLHIKCQHQNIETH